MAKHKSERINQMINGFMEKHNEGLSIPEIAALYKVDFSSVYNNLQEIADNHGVTRESLLQIVRTDYSNKEKSQTSHSTKTKKEEIHPKDLLNQCDDLLNEIITLQATIQIY